MVLCNPEKHLFKLSSKASFKSLWWMIEQAVQVLSFKNVNRNKNIDQTEVQVSLYICNAQVL